MDAAALVEGILRGEPGAAFLEAAEASADAATLAEVVRALRPLAAVPSRLREAVGALGCPVLDLCGTGGSPGDRLNTSTLAALMAPDLGVMVAKHGGRSASGKVGSLDLLERLGLDLAAQFDHAAEALRTTGVAFLPARWTYGLFGRWAPVRKGFGLPTIFNRLGPLLNPVVPTHRLMGAWSPEVAAVLAEVVRRLGERAFVVCAEAGGRFLDEASPFGETLLWDASPAGVRQRRLAALEEAPGDPAAAFGDPVAAASRLLAGVDDPGTRAGAALVAYNLALAGELARVGKDGADAGDDAFAARVAAAYRGIRATFPDRCARARGRIERLAALVPEHPATPVRVACEAAADEAAAPGQDRSPAALGHDAFRPLRDLPAGAPGWVFAEVKVRTPLRAFGGMPLDERVAAYEAGGAQALSVVTHPSFGGSLDLLRRVRALSDLPLLAKDFVREPADVEALARAGADGVLLLEDLVGAAGVTVLAEACRRLGATPFVEGSWGVPAGEALQDGVAVFNARSLFTLAEGRTYRDGVALRAARGRPDRRAVLASGADDPADAALLRRSARGVIVGTALMRLSSGAQVRDFVRACVSLRPILKACGAAGPADVEAALAAGADLVGVNLVRSSRRVVDRSALAAIVAASGAWPRRLVFVTDSDTDPALLDLARGCAALEQPYGVPLLPGPSGLLVPSPSAAPSGLRLRVLDGPAPGAGVVSPFPPNAGGDPAPVLASGGVRPENAVHRLAEARAAGWWVAGADAASGIEGGPGPGRFDPARIAALRQALDEGA